MDFTYNSYEKYVQAYSYLLTVLEDFSYIRDDKLITVENPDEEIIATLNGFK